MLTDWEFGSLKIQNLNEKEEVMRLRHTMALRLGEDKHTQVLLFDLAKRKNPSR